MKGMNNMKNTKLTHAEILSLLENDPANYGPGEPFSDETHGEFGTCSRPCFCEEDRQIAAGLDVGIRPL